MSTLNVATVNATTALNTAAINGGQLAGFRNRIINGGMVVDQRNAGSSYTITGDTEYGLDRWRGRTFGGAGRFSMQRVTDAPAGFTYSDKLTVTTTDTSGSYGYALEQIIEGYNVSDFNFGSANASTFTVSFWVKSSITGTYTVSASTYTRTGSCVSTYTITSANTWEYKTITFPANTAYTTNTTNLEGLFLDFGLGAQTSKSTATLNTWQGGAYVFTSGQVDWINTSGATFYLTGVQFELGSTATTFEQRGIGTELALCQRYYQKLNSLSGGNVGFGYGICYSTTSCFAYVKYAGPMRAAPTISQSNTGLNDGTVKATTALSSASYGDNSLAVIISVASGLTVGRGAVFCGNSTSAYIDLAAEL